MELEEVSQVQAFLDSSRAFNPADIQPKLFEFGVDKTRANRRGDFQKLFKRLPIEDFSTRVGWRPAGRQPGQIKLYVTRFPWDFNILSMGKIVLPYCVGIENPPIAVLCFDRVVKVEG